MTGGRGIIVESLPLIAPGQNPAISTGVDMSPGGSMDVPRDIIGDNTRATIRSVYGYGMREFMERGENSRRSKRSAILMPYIDLITAIMIERRSAN